MLVSGRVLGGKSQEPHLQSGVTLLLGGTGRPSMSAASTPSLTRSSTTPLAALRMPECALERECLSITCTRNLDIHFALWKPFAMMELSAHGMHSACKHQRSHRLYDREEDCGWLQEGKWYWGIVSQSVIDSRAGERACTSGGAALNERFSEAVYWICRSARSSSGSQRCFAVLSLSVPPVQELGNC